MLIGSMKPRWSLTFGKHTALFAQPSQRIDLLESRVVISQRDRHAASDTGKHLTSPSERKNASFPRDGRSLLSAGRDYCGDSSRFLSTSPPTLDTVQHKIVNEVLSLRYQKESANASIKKERRQGAGRPRIHETWREGKSEKGSHVDVFCAPKQRQYSAGTSR